MNDKQSILIVDAYNILYRAFYGNPNQLSKDGTNIGAVYTAFNMIFSTGKFDKTVVVFDGGGDNFRKELSSDYKDNRSSMPDDLQKQIQIFKDGLNVLDIKCLTPIGYEADDLIGSIAKHYMTDHTTVILSSDKDFRQLLSNENISIYDSMNKIYYNKDNLLEKMGVQSHQIVDYLSLLGDSSDNVSGVAGIGKKTASDILSKYDNITNIYENKDKINFRGKDNFILAYENKTLEKNNKLISLNTDLFNQNLNVVEEFNFNNHNFIPNPDTQDIIYFIEKWGFHSWKKKSLVKI